MCCLSVCNVCCTSPLRCDVECLSPKQGGRGTSFSLSLDLTPGVIVGDFLGVSVMNVWDLTYSTWCIVIRSVCCIQESCANDPVKFALKTNYFIYYAKQIRQKKKKKKSYQLRYLKYCIGRHGENFKMVHACVEEVSPRKLNLPRQPFRIISVQFVIVRIFRSSVDVNMIFFFLSRYTD